MVRTQTVSWFTAARVWTFVVCTFVWTTSIRKVTFIDIWNVAIVWFVHYYYYYSLPWNFYYRYDPPHLFQPSELVVQHDMKCIYLYMICHRVEAHILADSYNELFREWLCTDGHMFWCQVQQCWTCCDIVLCPPYLLLLHLRVQGKAQDSTHNKIHTKKH